MKKTPLKKYTQKSHEKRKEERKDYPEFYKKHIQIIKDSNLFCEECGHKLIGDSSEVCHILPKSTFKSISCFDENIIYLCGWKSGNNCHGKFDNCDEKKFKEMIVFPKICSIFEVLEREVEEKINHKIYSRYSCQI